MATIPIAPRADNDGGSIGASDRYWTNVYQVNAVISGTITDGVDSITIGDITPITTIQWGYVAGLDQSLSTSDNVTFSNIAGTITTASQPNIDHDTLTNFAADEHVAHSTVSIVAGNGLTGGGAISATRTLSVDINGATSKATPIGADEILIADSVAGFGIKKALLSSITGVSIHSALSGLAADDHTQYLLVDGTRSMTGSLDLAASTVLSFNGLAILSDVAGTMTLSEIDAIDATTETTLEAAIDSLLNLTAVGALNAGSITSGFGTINTGSSSITTTGAGSFGALTASGIITLGAASLIYPATDGTTGYFLKTDGATNLSWDSAANAAMARITGSTYSTIQHMQDTFHSSGIISGGGITDDTDGTITVAAGTGFIRATNSSVAQLLFTDWASEAGVNVALVDTDMNYIYVEYNAGSPQVIATTVIRADENTNILLGTVYRDGTSLYITEYSKTVVGDHALQMIRRLRDIDVFTRVDGGITSATGVLNIAITAGTWWEGLTKFTTNAFDSSVADTFSYFYADGLGGWTEAAAQTAINNTQYDDGSGVLATLSNNKYGVHWIYLGTDSSVYILYGTVDGTLTEAQDLGIPTSIPPFFDEGYVRLIGKVIIEKSAVVFTSIQSIFNGLFSLATAADHGNLIGLADDDHTQYLLISGTRSMTGSLDLAASTDITFNSVAILSDAAGVMTLSNIDAIDATTEATLESAIDSLSNLVTVGALNSGSITSGFGAINNGASSITTTGAGNFGALTASGIITLGAASLVYPATDGTATEFLTTNGATTLSWASVTDLTEDTDPVGSTDYVMTYDATASTHKKVTLDNVARTGFSASVSTATEPATTDYNVSTADYFYTTLGENITITFTNAPTSGRSFGFAIEFTKDATATERIITWPGSVVWSGGVSIASLVTSSQVVIVTFLTRDAGVTWYGSIYGDSFS